MKIIGLLIVLVFTQYLSAQTPDELKAALPQAAGWDIDPNIETFGPDNLFERINGAAEGYLLYDFKELTVFVYDQAGGNANSYITVQIYRHAATDDAFGIYASERPSKSNFSDFGVEGYREGSMLNFFVDRLYVKLESPSSSDETIRTLELIARKFGNNINPAATFPETLRFFPEENKVSHTEQFIPKGFLGHEFLNKAYTADYRVSDKKYQVFIIHAGTTADARAVLEKYYKFTKQTSKLREGRLTVKDRYNGDLECLWKGSYILGIVNENNAPVKVDDILKSIGKRLEN